MPPTVKSRETCAPAWNGLKLRMNAASPDPVATTHGCPAAWRTEPPDATVATSATAPRQTATPAEISEIRRGRFMLGLLSLPLDSLPAARTRLETPISLPGCGVFPPGPSYGRAAAERVGSDRSVTCTGNGYHISGVISSCREAMDKPFLSPWLE